MLLVWLCGVDEQQLRLRADRGYVGMRAVYTSEVGEYLRSCNTFAHLPDNASGENWHAALQPCMGKVCGVAVLSTGVAADVFTLLDKPQRCLKDYVSCLRWGNSRVVLAPVAQVESSSTRNGIQCTPRQCCTTGVA